MENFEISVTFVYCFTYLCLYTTCLWNETFDDDLREPEHF